MVDGYVYYRAQRNLNRANDILDLANSQLQRCEICSQIDIDNVSRTKIGSDGISRGLEHHKSWAELKAAALAGCQLCKLFYFVKVETDKQSGKPHDVSSIGQLYVQRSSSSLTFGTNFMDVIRFRVLAGNGMPSWRFTRDRSLIYQWFLDWPKNDARDGDEALPARLVEDDPASEISFSRAQRWIDHCKFNHPNCLPNEDVPLPTRVLDAGTSPSTEVVSLFISDGQHSKYTALSHCWGDSSRANDQM